ncbi:MFS transporter [Oceanobacillus piezotolerans]|uniref:MFS transporter n=1 Tax=Oceanobacillus piezotolerans TaxID=2448030 RepID=A0A498DHX9_9BACI|nr:glycoside-pentoside-hexuronide (GPH):cation symporter [Oceanobacillus piezotolerans]RLL40704.1 MFS transporter [Oceanobacillus piezotolerans]
MSQAALKTPEQLPNNTKPVRPFGMRDKIGYLFGDFGNDFSFILVSTFLMVYYTDVFGISAAAVGTLFLVARFWDAITDVVWGRFIDSRKTTSKGKFKPWIFRMSFPLAIATILLFLPIPGMSDGFYLAYAYVTYMAWAALYGTVNIPYGSMASVISSDSTDRASLSGWRTTGAMAANLVISAGAPLIVFVDNEVSASRLSMIAVLFAILAIACYMACVNLTTERIKQPEKKPGENINFATTVKGLAKNKPLITLLVASILFMLTMMLVGSINIYLFKDYFENATAFSIFSLIQSGAVFLAMPALTPLVKRFGKKELGSAGMLIAGIAYLVLYLIPNISLPVFFTINAIGLFGFAFFNLIIWAFVSDAIDYQEYLTGSREDGTVYAVYSFARKIGQAFAGGLAGYALTFVGYNNAATVQAQEVKDGIYTVATLIPAITYFIVFLILVFVYPLNKERTKKLEIALAEKREAAKE